MELTQTQIERQDFVDNAIHRLVNELVPEEYRNGKEHQVSWSIATIGRVRDVIEQELTLDFANNIKERNRFEQAFYPYIKE